MIGRCHLGQIQGSRGKEESLAVVEDDQSIWGLGLFSHGSPSTTGEVGEGMTNSWTWTIKLSSVPESINTWIGRCSQDHWREAGRQIQLGELEEEVWGISTRTPWVEGLWSAGSMADQIILWWCMVVSFRTQTQTPDLEQFQWRFI